MPEFTVKIRDVKIEADTPHDAAVKTATVIALMSTINVMDVVDAEGTVHEITLSIEETESAIAEAAAKMAKIRPE